LKGVMLPTRVLAVGITTVTATAMANVIAPAVLAAILTRTETWIGTGGGVAGHPKEREA